MAKKVLWTVAAAAAVALVALRVVGYPPVEKGTEATIGAAQRYQESQVSASDVKVEDQQFQAFLQSDLFRQLANDKAARNALNNPDLQKALADASVRAVLSRTEVRTEIANNAKHLARVDVRTEVANNARQQVRVDAVANVIANLRLDASSQAALEAALNVSPALLRAITDVNVADAIANSSLALVLVRADAAVAVSNNAVLNALNQAALNVQNSASANASNNAVIK